MDRWIPMLCFSFLYASRSGKSLGLSLEGRLCRMLGQEVDVLMAD